MVRGCWERPGAELGLSGYVGADCEEEEEEEGWKD